MRTHHDSHTISRQTPLRGVSWKNALGSMLHAASRLHHYRDVHAWMMREALCELDCRRTRETCDDE